MNLPSLPTGYFQLILVVVLYLIFSQYQEDSKEIIDAVAKSEAAYNDYFLNYATLSTDSLIKEREIESSKHDIVRIEKYWNDSKSTKSAEFLLPQLDSTRNSLNATTLELRNITSKISVLRSNLEEVNSTNKLLRKETRLPFYITMSVLACFALFQIAKESIINSQMNKIKLFKNRTYKNCQSCAKAFSPLLLNGKNKDGTVNEGFCIECYDNGVFINSELTKQVVIDEYQKANPNERKRNIDKKVSKLIRWNTNPFDDTFYF